MVTFMPGRNAGIVSGKITDGIGARKINAGIAWYSWCQHYFVLMCIDHVVDLRMTSVLHEMRLKQCQLISCVGCCHVESLI